jgi:3-methyladenine DNA glycosylase AlkD
MSLSLILEQLRSHADPSALPFLKKYGMDADSALGVKLPHLRRIAREYRKQHGLALELWATGIHEARILASMVADPAKMDKKTLLSWIKDFRSWDLCDQTCINLMVKMDIPPAEMLRWAEDPHTFTRRAAYAMMAVQAVHHKKTPDSYFLELIPFLLGAASDPEHMVRKAVSWALRQIGKRNPSQREKVLEALPESPSDKNAGKVFSEVRRELLSKA